MKKKILAIIVSTVLVLPMVACESSSKTPTTVQEQRNEDIVETESGGIEVEKNVFSVELTIPADYVGKTTQDELNTISEEKGYKSITLNDDGTVTYVMTKNQHKELISELTTEINNGIDELLSSEDYRFTSVKTNDDFTNFEITITSTELSISESFSIFAFYMYGAMYNAFNGTPVDNVHIDFINESTGEIIDSCNSSDMG